MALGKRIEQRLTELNKKSAWLSRELGLQSNSTIRGLINRDAETSSHTPNLARILGVRLEWLSSGEEPMLEFDAKSSLIPEQSIIAVDDGSDHSDTHEKVQRFDIKLSAGNGTAEWVIRENDDDPIFFRKGWFKARRLNPDVLKAMYVRGESMEPYLFNHDTVFIDITDSEIVDGEVYALVFKNKFYVKELQNLDGEVKIISHNKKYTPMQTDFAVEKDNYTNYFEVIGRVVWRGG